MDKYEYRLKTDQMKKLMDHKDALGAMKIADTIDWRRVKDVKMLTMAAESYVANGKYDTAIDLFLQAYEFAPIGRRIMYRLTEVAIEAGNFQDAKTYYEEFHEIAPHDLGAYILKYQLEKAKGAPVEQLIEILEAYRVQDFDERWSYELAELYYKAGRREDCVRLCDDIILWFSLGKYVEKAMRLKMMYEPLTPSQREKAENQAKYAEKLRIFQEESERQEQERLAEEEKERRAAVRSESEETAEPAEEKSEPVPAVTEFQPEPWSVEISDQERKRRQRKRSRRKLRRPGAVRKKPASGRKKSSSRSRKQCRRKKFW